MYNDGLLMFRILFAGCFLATLVYGYPFMTRMLKQLGATPDVPSETPGARSYGRLPVIVIWLHAVVIFGALTLALH